MGLSSVLLYAKVSCLINHYAYTHTHMHLHAYAHTDIRTDIFVDTVGDPETYKARLVRSLGDEFGNFTIEKKADATYKVG